MKVRPFSLVMALVLFSLIGLVVTLRAYETPALALPLYLGIFVSATILIRTLMGRKK